VDDAALTTLLCDILGTVPGWEWRPTGPAYTANEVAIYYGAIPEEKVRASVGVRIYQTSDDTVEALHSRRAQLRFRGPRGVRDGADKLAHPAFLVLTGLSRVGGISGISRISMAPLGADENGREERTDNYTITLDNTEAST
jgi:hypothetical protein